MSWRRGPAKPCGMLRKDDSDYTQENILLSSLIVFDVLPDIVGGDGEYDGVA